MNSFFRGVLFLGVVAQLAACSSGTSKRKDQQNQIVKSSKLYCEWVNGENQSDVDVVLNISMGQKCDANRPFSISDYKTANDITGMMFCCAVADKSSESKDSVRAEAKAEVKAEPVAAPAAEAPAAAPAVAPKTETPPAETKPAPRAPNSSKQPPTSSKSARPSQDLDL